VGKVAFVFPGQGAQKVGMGKEAFDSLPAARRVFEAADAALGEKLSQLCFEGPEEALKLTANTQPAVLTTAIALFEAFADRCDLTAGHSLGEYAAHVCAGTLSFEDAVRIVRVRGTYMQEAVPLGEGAMAAVMGLGREVVDRLCRETTGIVEPVNYNCPGQIVVAGSAQGVATATEALKAAGGKAIALPVSAPFHSSLMTPAEERLKAVLMAATLSPPRCPVYVNVDAEPVVTAAAARDGLVRQVSRPVRWEESVRRMIADGATLFVEIGPGKVLTGLIGRIDKSVQRVNIETPADFERARSAIAAARS